MFRELCGTEDLQTRSEV